MTNITETSMKSPIKRSLRRLKTNAYFLALPFCNYAINLLKHSQLNFYYIPKVIQIETTNYCNAKCHMCPHEKIKRERGHMPWDIFTKIIDESAEFEGKGLKFILHKDGEPLMDPLLFKRIEYIKSKMTRSRVHFNTNASLLNDENINRILDSSLDSILFSVDGASADTYERIRTGLKYEAIKNNIENFFQEKKQRGKSIHTMMQMVMDKTNIHEVSEYKKLWDDKANELKFKNMHNFLVQKTSIHGDSLSEKQLQRCLMPFLMMLFYHNGDVALCCWDYDNIVGLGNIEKEPLLEIYNNSKFREIRRAMKKRSCKGVKPCNICSQIYGEDGPIR